MAMTKRGNQKDKTTLTMSFLLAITAFLLLGFVNASLDPTSGSSYHHHDDRTPSSLFTYSQAFAVDLSSSGEAEYDHVKDAVSFWMQQQQPSVLGTSCELIYGDSGSSSSSDVCLVSSQTIMESHSSSTGGSLFQGNCVFQQDFEVDLDSEDENDDDDDGHSSMLSNASCLRARLEQRRRQEYASSSSSVAMLNLRGGGDGGGLSSLKSIAGSSLGSEMSKKLFVTALVTLIFEGTIGHILEFLKIVMQTSSSDATSYAHVIRQITAEKGITGLWDGFCPWGIVQAVSKGAVFGLAYAAAAGVLVPMAEKGTIPMPLALTLAGGIGGGFQGYVLSPTLLLKTRVMTNEVFREKMSVLRTTLLSFRIGYDVVKTEGLLTLMKGSNVFATKRVFDWASRYFFADMFETLFAAFKKDGQPLSVAEKSASSLLGGVASTCVTLPLDVLVAKTQDAKKAGVKVSALTLFREELQEKGLRGLKDAYMRGFEARLLHVCLTTLVIKTGTPIAYEAIFGSATK